LEKGSTQAEHLPGRLPHYAPANRELARLEAEAKAAKIGLWSRPDPVPPWEWRRGEGVPQMAGVIGNRRSRLYHEPTCRGAARMNARNRIEFPSPLSLRPARGLNRSTGICCHPAS
jgi:hypothetical protein